MYKVFFNERFILLNDNEKSLKNIKNLSIIYVEKMDDLSDIIDEFNKNKNSKSIALISSDLQRLFLKFKNNFSFIEAAGGVIFNNDDEILLIKRNGFWDLPKGKVEQNETYTDAALREVTEECGINNQKIVSELKPSFHTYFSNNKLYLKKTHWFKMKYEGFESLKPQKEEGLTDAVWVKIDKIENYYLETYLSIVDVIKNCLN